MQQAILKQLLEQAEPTYQQFSSKLLPGVSNILGVRLPRLRKIAKQIAKEDWRAYLRTAQDDWMEQTMLQGMVIGYIKTDLHERLACIEAFVPKINNWSVCDSFCAGLTFVKTNREHVWEFLQPYLYSDQEFLARFGVAMLLFHYIQEEYIDRVLQVLESVPNKKYYAQMAVAWALSMCYVHFPKQTLPCLQNSTLDSFTYNKALQKIVESRRVAPQDKEYIRTLRR